MSKLAGLSPLVLVLLIATAGSGCIGGPTVRGEWRSSNDGIASDGACYGHAFFFADAVSIEVRDEGGAVIVADGYACDDESFELDLPESIGAGRHLVVVASAGSSEGESGTATLEVITDSDGANVGLIRFVSH